MIAFPNCKINLGLNIIRKREDGFHDLETVFLPIVFTDVLEIIPLENSKGVLHLVGAGHFAVTGINVSADENNLCVKAYNILKKDFPEVPAINMHLLKAIPLGAGLGGGSADGAFTLKLLNDKFHLGLSTEKLLNYALQLGSDCPFFIINKPCYATGRGEILEVINHDLSEYKLVIINPGIHIETKWAFSKIVPQQPNISARQIITQPIETWKDDLKNDFEIPVFEKYPEIKNIKENLYGCGAAYASLSGTGSTVYGIFKKDKTISYLNNNKYFYKIIELSKS